MQSELRSTVSHIYIFICVYTHSHENQPIRKRTNGCYVNLTMKKPMRCEQSILKCFPLIHVELPEALKYPTYPQIDFISLQDPSCPYQAFKTLSLGAFFVLAVAYFTYKQSNHKSFGKPTTITSQTFPYMKIQSQLQGFLGEKSTNLKGRDDAIDNIPLDYKNFHFASKQLVVFLANSLSLD